MIFLGLKKITFCSLLFTRLTFFALSQDPQPMMALPDAMKYPGEVASETRLKTICLDYFKAAPNMDHNYERIRYNSSSDKKLEGLKKFGRVTTARGIGELGLTTHMELVDVETGNTIKVENNDPFVVSTEKYRMSKHYLSFVRSKIDYYKLSFNSDQHIKLQCEVWRYNILDQLGYIEGKGDPLVNFENAKKKISQDFGMSIDVDASILEVGRVLSYLGIWKNEGKSREVFFIRKTENTDRYVAYSFDDDYRLVKLYGESDLSVLVKKLKGSLKESEEVGYFLESVESSEQDLIIASFKEPGGAVTIDLKALIDEEKELQELSINFLRNFEILYTSSVGEQISEFVQSSGISTNNGNVRYTGPGQGSSWKVKVENSDDFIKLIRELEKQSCELQICISNDGNLSVGINCGETEFVISTSGEVTLTLSSGRHRLIFSNMSLTEGCDMNGQICLNQEGQKEETVEIQCSKSFTLSNQEEVEISSPSGESIKF